MIRRGLAARSGKKPWRAPLPCAIFTASGFDENPGRHLNPPE